MILRGHLHIAFRGFQALLRDLTVLIVDWNNGGPFLTLRKEVLISCFSDAFEEDMKRYKGEDKKSKDQYHKG